MRRSRWTVPAAALAASAVLAFFLRDAVYQAVVLPLSYLFWVAWTYYSVIPQLFVWVIFLVILLITTISNFLPNAGNSSSPAHKRQPEQGKVEVLAGWMHKGRKGSYFKWQIANRLGRLARELGEMSGRYARPPLLRAPDPAREQLEAVQNYFDAGLNTSFIDYAIQRNRSRRPASTPLDLDPRQAVDYLEAQLEMTRGRRP
jgi:energy-coupling factor transporter transmembrane protein EcfT